MWKNRRERIVRVRNSITGAVRSGAGAAAQAVGAGVGLLGQGLGGAKTYLQGRARNAYNLGTRKATEAYQALRRLSPKRKATNFFLGKKGNNGTRAGGVRGKVVNLTRKAAAGFEAAKQAAGKAMNKAKNAAVAAKNAAKNAAKYVGRAATKKASNIYAYGRNMIKYGRRRTNVERLESQRRRAGNAAEASNAAVAAGKQRNANVAAAKEKAKLVKEAAAEAAAVQKALKETQKSIVVAAEAEAAGNEAKAAGAVTTGLTKLRAGLATVGGPIAAAATSVIGSIRAAFTRRKNNKNGAKNTPTAANASNARTLNAAASQLGNAANAVAAVPAAIRSNNPSAVQSRISAVRQSVQGALTKVAQSARAGTQSVRASLKKFGNAAMNQAHGIAAGFSGFGERRRFAINTRRQGRLNIKKLANAPKPFPNLPKSPLAAVNEEVNI
jgi:hypothetical protein